MDTKWKSTVNSETINVIVPNADYSTIAVSQVVLKTTVRTLEVDDSGKYKYNSITKYTADYGVIRINGGIISYEDLDENSYNEFFIRIGFLG
jgi:hypothetical protein